MRQAHVPAAATLLTTVLLVSSCAIDRAGTGTSPVYDGPPPTEKHSDRPAPDVEAGLATLKACDLVDTAVLDRHGIDHHSGLGRPKRTMEIEPGIVDECKTVDDYLFGAVSVALGGEFTESGRFDLARTEVSGYTAYFGDVTISPQFESSCTVEFPISFTRSIRFEIKIQAGDNSYDPCEAVKDLATAAVPRITDAAGEEFLYRPDEHDEQTGEPCVHYLSAGSHEGCVPYQEIPIPNDPKTMLAAADGNANITCAAAVQTIRETLGEDMQVVTYGQSCVFVEPTHSLTASVFMSDGYVPKDYDFGENSGETTIAGHPAIASTTIADDGSTAEKQFYIAPGNDLTAPGVVGISITIDPPRGASFWITKVDPAKLNAIDSVAEELMAKYFS